MKEKIVYWITGSQTLYGEDVLAHVAEHSKEMADYVSEKMPVTVKYLATCKSSEEVDAAIKAVNCDENCIGVIVWCHTFSPAKMWIKGLKKLQKPLCHFATQYNKELPYATIDMDFMNENQSAHGDREFGYILARLRLPHKVVVGHFTDERALHRLADWCIAAAGYAFSERVKVCRFSDNMRGVAVTEGDKVEAHIKFGWQVDYFPIAELEEAIGRVTDAETDALLDAYKEKYTLATENFAAVREQAKYEIAIERFLKERGGYNAFVDHFGTLGGLHQLPGLAVQDLQAKGYGFGPEGDWKVAALGVIMSYMAGNSCTGMMEDYTYDLSRDAVLGAHMLEVCPQFAKDRPRIEVHPLSIGGKEDPARLVFEGISAPEAIAATMVDMGGRMRLIIQQIELVPSPEKMPNLPVGSLMWQYKSGFDDGVAAWLYAGGAHHSVVSAKVTMQEMLDLAEMWDIEAVVIDENTDLAILKRQLAVGDKIWNA